MKVQGHFVKINKKLGLVKEFFILFCAIHCELSFIFHLTRSYVKMVRVLVATSIREAAAGAPPDTLLRLTGTGRLHHQHPHVAYAWRKLVMGNFPDQVEVYSLIETPRDQDQGAKRHQYIVSFLWSSHCFGPAQTCFASPRQQYIFLAKETMIRNLIMLFEKEATFHVCFFSLQEDMVILSSSTAKKFLLCVHLQS